MWGIQIGALALALLAASGCAHAIDGPHGPHGPHGPRGRNVVYLDQGWGDEERRIFYRASQGARLLPLSWFLALEREDSEARLVASDYVTRYRFIEDPGSKSNPERLPVGFARDVDAATGEVYVGFTCGTCHTRQISYRGAKIRIDGGPANIDVVAFTDAVFGALDRTLKTPEKLKRFARAVLKDDRGEASVRALRARMEKMLAGARLQAFTGGAGAHATVAGFGRLDALGRAGNLLLGQLDPKSLRVTNAPVDYPHLWDAPTYDWVQWNGSIMQPMTRNIAEALGVGTHTQLVPESQGTRVHVQSSIRVDNLRLLDQQVEKLRAPRWPEHLFGRIDQERAARGRLLYSAHCARCHEPELTPPNEHGKRFRRAMMSPLDEIGTDPTDAVSFSERTVDLGALGLGRMGMAQALALGTQAIRDTKYEAYGLSPEQRLAWDGYRPNVWRAPLAYKARDLRGIWATAPYLHNGSVPSLYELLLPADRRSKRFYLGSTELDPRRVGLRVEPFQGGFELVTDLIGNSNAGHEYRDGPREKGVIGPALTEDERWDLVEYLKTL
ncbi:di-heme-cytochrome C peroxidase [Sorangium sp. So ce1099]|uniref:di-heme-cytochrome C peroxidase n=1 Tax=Sorangium sp. So ce1099 TaxID=3133331 RepID=UPI003F5E9C00